MRQRLNARLIAALSVCAIAMLPLVALAPVAAAQGGRLFPETGYTVSGPFLAYWQSRGGLAAFGYPLSEARVERGDFPGGTALVQWFERARFELHPEGAGT